MILKKIKKNLKDHIQIYFFSIHDDSASHNRYTRNHLTHLKLILVSDDFINKSLITRHRMIFLILKKIIQQTIYSITLYTYTVIEWSNKDKKNFTTIKCIRKNIYHNVMNNLE